LPLFLDKQKEGELFGAFSFGGESGAPSAQRGKSKVSIKGKIPTGKVKCPITIKDADKKALLKKFKRE